MIIELNEITIRDLVKGYIDNKEEGVTGYNGKLNIRPKYQREFVYKEKPRNAVINSIMKEYPLNVMYWIKNKGGTYGLLDGQQRTISICEYIEDNFSIKQGELDMCFTNLTETEQKQILDYKLMIYFCEGTEKEELNWFKIINIAGEPLTEQELKNAVYTGPWLSDAKKHFSKTNCPAYNLASDYIKGSPIRQEYLETAIKWISNGKIDTYMSKHQHNPNANNLWLYFQKVINWIKVIFPEYRREMKGLPFGTLYNKFKNKQLNPDKLEIEITKLMENEEVQKKSGIYEYVLTRNEKYLNLRSFTDAQKREAYERQKGICECKKHFKIEDMEAHHIKEWSKEGKTIPENCQMLCKACHDKKSGK